METVHSYCSRKQAWNDFTIADDHHRTTDVRLVLFMGVDPQIVEERRRHVVWLVNLADWSESFIVSRSDDLTWLYATARQQHEHGTSVAITSIAFLVDLRRASKLSRHEDTGGSQKSFLGKIIEQRRKTFVKWRKLFGLQFAPIVLISIPATVVQSHEADTGFNQARGKQTSHAKFGFAKLLGVRWRLLAHLKRFS